MSGTNETIGSRVRDFRRQKGFTQAQLAEQLGVSRQTVNYIENGMYCPSTKLALLLARELGATVEQLFYLIEERKQ